LRHDGHAATGDVEKPDAWRERLRSGEYAGEEITLLLGWHRPIKTNQQPRPIGATADRFGRRVGTREYSCEREQKR